MSLRRKTILVLGLGLVFFVCVLLASIGWLVSSGFASIETTMDEGFNRVEREDAQRNLQRLDEAVNSEIGFLYSKVFDWSSWDEAYEYVQSPNPDFVAANITADALNSLHVNLIAYFDTAGVPVGGIWREPLHGNICPIPASLMQLFSANKSLRGKALGRDCASIILIDSLPLLFAARPVLYGDGTGTPRGFAILARAVDSRLVAELSRRVRSDISVAIIAGGHWPDHIPASLKDSLQLPLPTDIAIRDARTILGTIILKDYNRLPVLACVVSMSRGVHGEALRTLENMARQKQFIVWLLLFTQVGGSIVFVAMVIFMLDKFVLRRVSALASNVLDLGSQGVFSGRITDEAAADEIGTLAMSINDMLSGLEIAHSQIGEQNDRMRLIMDHVTIGLLTLDEHLCIEPAFSASITHMLGRHDLVKRPFSACLGFGLPGKESSRLELDEYLDVLRQDLLVERDIAALNPFSELELSRKTDSIWLRLRYALIRSTDGPNRVLVQIEDITAEKKLAADIALSKRENRHLRAIAENPDLYREFMTEIGESVAHLAANPLMSNCTDAQVHALFRDAHSIKSAAATFGLTDLRDIAAHIEELLSEVRNHAVSAAEVQPLLGLETGKITTAFHAARERASSLLGDMGYGDQILLHVPLASIRAPLALLNSMSAADAIIRRTQLLETLHALKKVPARRGFARTSKVLEDVLARVSKKAVLVFEGQDTEVDIEIASILNTVLTHVIRNSVDHGIEYPEQRIAAGKPESGTVTLSVLTEGRDLVVRVSDDGCGIDLNAVRRRSFVAVPEGGEDLRSDAEVLNSIFLPGVSTADSVSDISGRGVGLDAVRDTVVYQLAGSISVETRAGQGSSFIIRVPAHRD